MAIRTASLEYLGIVAARLRKDAVSSQLNQETIDEIISKVNEEDNVKGGEDTTPKKASRGRKTPEVSEKICAALKVFMNFVNFWPFLQGSHLLGFSVLCTSNPLLFAR